MSDEIFGYRFEYSYSVYANLGREPREPEAIGAKCLETLRALEAIDPIFGDWEMMNYPSRQCPLEDVLGDMGAYVANNISRDPDSDLPPTTTYGYRVQAFSRTRLTDRAMGVGVVAGALSGNQVVVDAGNFMRPANPALVTLPRFKAVLLTLIATWGSQFGVARAFQPLYYKGSDATGGAPFPFSDFQIPWFAYLAPNLARGLSPAPGIITELAPDGGLLMFAAQTRLDPTNPDHMRNARVIANIMIDKLGAD